MTTRLKVQKDKNGNRFVKVGAKKVTINHEITTKDFLKWLTTMLRGKRKRKPRKKETKLAMPAPPAARDFLEMSPDQAASESVRNYLNVERVKAGRDPLDAPAFPGAPAPLDPEVLEKRQKKRAERKAREDDLIAHSEAAWIAIEKQAQKTSLAHLKRTLNVERDLKPLAVSKPQKEMLRKGKDQFIDYMLQ